MYKNVNARQSQLTAINTATSSFSSTSKSMAANTATLNMSDLDESLYSLKSQFDSLYPSLDANTEEAKKLKAAYDDAIKNTTAYYTALEKQSAEAEAKKSKESYQSSFRSEMGNWIQSTNTFGMDERNAALYKMQIEYQGKERTALAAQINAYYDLVDAEKAQQEQLDMLNSIYGSLGEFGQVMSLISGAGGDWISLVMNLVSQLDVVQPLLSVITDDILPVLNAFLQPFLPLVQVIGSILTTIVDTVLRPLFPILKGIAKISVTCWYAVKIAFDFIRDTIKVVCGSIQLFVLNLYNGIVRTLKGISIFGWHPFGWMSEANTSQAEDWAKTDVLGNMNQNIAEMKDSLASIDSMTMDIKDNTDSKNNEQLKAYNELFHSGILSESEYLARVSALNGKNYDNVHSYKGADYYRGAGGNTNVSYGGVSISINGGNYDAKELAREVAKVLQQQTRAGSAAY